MTQREKENFYRNSTIIVDHGKEALQILLDNELSNRGLTPVEFINKYRHDIYHLCYPRHLCCQCTGGLLPRSTPSNRVLYPEQLDLLLDKKATKLTVHNPRNRNVHCCSPAISSVSIDRLDVTLIRCLLINFADNCKKGTNIRYSVEKLAEYRNKLFAHTEAARISDEAYTVYKANIEKAIMTISRHCNVSSEMAQKLRNAENRPLDETVCLQYQLTLLDERRKQKNATKSLKRQLKRLESTIQTKLRKIERSLSRNGDTTTSSENKEKDSEEKGENETQYEEVKEFTIDGILTYVNKFLGPNSSSVTNQWICTRSLEKISDTAIWQSLERIKQKQENFQGDWVEIWDAINWTCHNSKLLPLEGNIRNKIGRLINVLKIESLECKTKEAALLKEDIFDVNNGALVIATALNFYLGGNSHASPDERGLLEIWSDKLYKYMLQKPEFTAKLYIETLNAYVDNMAVLQFLAITLFVVAQSDERICKQEVKLFQSRLKAQKSLVGDSIPPSAIYLMNPSHQCFVIGVPGKLESHVLYGVPTRTDGPTRNSVYLRERHKYNEDEEWIFEKSSTYDVNGSLVISENSKKLPSHQGGYLTAGVETVLFVFEYVTPYCSADIDHADEFSIIPVFLNTDSKLGIMIYNRSHKKYLSIANAFNKDLEFKTEPFVWSMYPFDH